MRNLVVPVVGNFAGPKAIRAIAKYLKAHGAVVSAFYVSNVEQYLTREGGLEEFCANASMLPLDDTSTFIRSERGGFPPRFGRTQPGRTPPNRGAFGGNFSSKLWNMLGDLKECTNSWERHFNRKTLRFSTNDRRLRSPPSVSFLKSSKL